MGYKEVLNIKKPTNRAKPWVEASGLARITGWAMNGLTDEQIAKNMGIAYSTLSVWRKEYSVISEALKKAKEVVDLEIQGKLYQRAFGYEYEETKTYIEEVDGKRKIKREVHQRHMAPDTTAQIFWLKNRMPDKWRNKIEYESGEQIDKLDLILEEFITNANN